MLVKDELDVVGHTLRHLVEQVDWVFVADNLSTDGTLELMRELAVEGLPLSVEVDADIGYRQAEKTTRLARYAHRQGHSWICPVDADEVWFSPFGRIGDILAGLPLDSFFAPAVILNHITTGRDDPREANPLRRIGWRLREHGALPKIACRAGAQLEIGMGNHEAWNVGRVSARSLGSTPGQLYIHHYPWRSPEQFERKIRNGARAYAAAPEIAVNYGEHWRQFGMPEDEGFEERVRGWFDAWGYVRRPDDRFVYDPAPAVRPAPSDADR